MCRSTDWEQLWEPFPVWEALFQLNTLNIILNISPWEELGLHKESVTQKPVIKWPLCAPCLAIQVVFPSLLTGFIYGAPSWSLWVFAESLIDLVLLGGLDINIKKNFLKKRLTVDSRILNNKGIFKTLKWATQIGENGARGTFYEPSTLWQMSLKRDGKYT